MSHPVETELALRLHRDFRKWAGNMGCGDHLPETWNAIAETAQEYLQLRGTAKVHIGTSVLSRDLVWCDCGRVLALTGKWMFCPNCGRQIDQESYRTACAEALKHGATLYRNVEETEKIQKLANAMTKALFDWRGFMEFCRALNLMGALETPKAFNEGADLAWQHLGQAEELLNENTK